MGEYICKCGKTFTKNTSAAVTGYRDTADCTGCPYLLEYGPQKWDGSGFRLDVQGHECRATQALIYRTALSGDLTGKNSLHIMSLDFDFLERVSCWIKQHYPGAELSGTFSRGNIRGTDYEAHGRYSQGIYCAQNKAGVAAKQALLAEFFDGHGHRLDLSGDAEKAKILNDIERGKVKRMDYIISKRTSDGRLYALRNGNFYFYDKAIPMWLPSSWLTQGYEKARDKEEDFTKEDFMQCDPLELADEWELPCDVLEALERCKGKAQPCQCATCTCTDCHEQCFGNCTDCGAPTTDCNSYQTDGQKIPFGHSAAETGTAPDGRQDANAAETASAGGGSCDNLSQLKHWTPGGGAWDDSESMVDSEESEEEVCTQKSHKTEAPCSNAPSPKGQGSPADAGAAALSPCDAAPACSEAAFDYSGMDAQTVQDLQLAEREYKTGRKMAEIGLRRMAEAVAMAHEALCVTIATKCRNGGAFIPSEKTFGAWCESVGLNRKAAERLLNVAELFANSSPNQQKLLQELSPSLLYAAAKPSAPEEAVDLVKSGGIKTHKEYQQLLAQLKQAEAERDDARREKSELAADCNRLGLAADKARSDKRSLMEEINSRERKITELLNQSEAADQQAEKLRAELRQAKAALEGVNADSSVARERADRLAVELAESEAEIAQLKEQLAATPGMIDGHAIDTDELERRAEAMAKAKIEEENAKWTQMVEGLQKQVKQLQDGTDMPSKIGTAQALIDDILTGIEVDLNWMPINQQKDLRIRCALDDLVESLQEFADNFSKTDFGHGGEPDV